jgi:lipopolysaccharide/colanic/teichoic acid biosynthesis glycosyltransferase
MWSTPTVDERCRRGLDIVAASAGLIVLSPLLVAIGLLVKLDSPGPILYPGERVGRRGEHFRLYKFRSMVTDAARRGPGITTNGDPRITGMGRFLRRTKLDELPQLLNVVWGDMSLVGPRPEDARYVALYTEEQKRVLNVRPGITSAASVQYRHEERLLTGSDWEDKYVNVIMPEKLRIELDYLGRRTVFSDLLIIWQTLLVLFRQ